MDDMIERLMQDPGLRTLGQILQERGWAVQEVMRLRAELAKLCGMVARGTVADVGRISVNSDRLNPHRLIRQKELRQFLGLGATPPFGG